MLSVSLDCPFLIVPSVFSNVYSCCQYLWIVNSLFPVGFRQRLFMLPVSLDCPSLIAPSVFSNVYSCCQCLLIAPSIFSNVYSCCQCLWIAHPWLSLQFSLTFIHVASVSGLSILDCPSVFSNVYSCCQCLWIVHSWLPLRFSLTFIHVASVSGLSILDCPFGFLSSIFMLPVSLSFASVKMKQTCIIEWLVISANFCRISTVSWRSNIYAIIDKKSLKISRR